MGTDARARERGLRKLLKHQGGAQHRHPIAGLGISGQHRRVGIGAARNHLAMGRQAQGVAGVRR